MKTNILFYGGLFILLIPISISDIKYYRIPDKFVLLGSIWAIAHNLMGRGIGILEGCCGAIVGGGSMLLISYVSLLIFKKLGMGGGDIKLMAMAGLYLGWRYTLLSLLFAIYIAGCISMFLLATKKIDRNGYLPFGPFLGIGIILSILWGQELVDWYIKLFFY